MKSPYDSSATIIFLISILAILPAANTDVRAQMLKDAFDDPNWETRWEIHEPLAGDTFRRVIVIGMNGSGISGH